MSVYACVYITVCMFVCMCVSVCACVCQSLCLSSISQFIIVPSQGVFMFGFASKYFLSPCSSCLVRLSLPICHHHLTAINYDYNQPRN